MTKAEREKQYVANLTALVAEGYIKVRIPVEGGGGETLWAHPVGRNHAKLQNTPWFADGYGLNDIVRLKPGDGPFREVDRLISRGSVSVTFTYDAGGHAEARFAEVKTALTAGGAVAVEGARPGLAAASLPPDMPLAAIQAMFAAAPHVTGHSLGEATEADFAVDVGDVPLDDQL